jgi:DNA-directed RNA polymerase subunit RPC12/RpoP
MEIAFACPGCGKPVEGPIGPETTGLSCAVCGRTTPLPEVPELLAAPRLGRCPVCGSGDLYVQKDFHRGVGILLAAIGLLLGPFTSWISVGVALVVDTALYLVVPNVAICYACNAQLREFPKERAPGGFDIAIHDAYKFDRRHPPRREMAVAGPLAKRLRAQGRPAP